MQVIWEKQEQLGAENRAMRHTTDHIYSIRNEIFIFNVLYAITNIVSK